MNLRISLPRKMFSVEDSEYYMTKAKRMGLAGKFMAEDLPALAVLNWLQSWSSFFADFYKASDEGIRQMRDAGSHRHHSSVNRIWFKKEYAPGRK